MDPAPCSSDGWYPVGISQWEPPEGTRGRKGGEVSRVFLTCPYLICSLGSGGGFFPQ